MELFEICKRINLQENLARRVMEFSRDFDFADPRVDAALDGFFDRNKMESSLDKLKAVLGSDPDNIGALACMLYCAATKSYEFYRARGISDAVFDGTMGCFTRFAGECFVRTGRLWFDREWWTTRQVGCHLFRVGALEYEFVFRDGAEKVNLHIPSDADLSPASVDESLSLARSFVEKYFPEHSSDEWICNSWLLSPDLKDMLPHESNILAFQRRFRLTGSPAPDMSFMEWLFCTKDLDTDVASLPEDTSLRKNMKKFLQSGGVTGSTPGVLVR